MPENCILAILIEAESWPSLNMRVLNRVLRERLGFGAKV